MIALIISLKLIMKKTLIPEETKIVDKFKMDSTKIILCTDAGLASDKIKKFNIKDNRGFVITQSLKKLKDEYKQQVFNKSGWRIANDLRNIYNLDTIENDEELKEKYYDILFYKIIETETKSVKQDLIVHFVLDIMITIEILETIKLKELKKVLKQTMFQEKVKIKTTIAD